MLLVVGYFKFLFDFFFVENFKIRMGIYNVKGIINCLFVNMLFNYVYCFLFRYMF